MCFFGFIRFVSAEIYQALKWIEMVISSRKIAFQGSVVAPCFSFKGLHETHVFEDTNHVRTDLGIS